MARTHARSHWFLSWELKTRAHCESMFTRARNYSTCWIFWAHGTRDKNRRTWHRTLEETAYANSHEWRSAQLIALVCAGLQLGNSFGGQFTSSTQLIKPNYLFILPHRRNTIGFSLELTPLYSKYWRFDESTHRKKNNNKNDNIKKASLYIRNSIKLLLINNNVIEK